MGLFSYKSFYKPGKGVEKDAPEKHAFFQFFILYGRKFWRFLEVNLIYFVVLLPILMFLYGTAYDTLYKAFDAAGYIGTQATAEAGTLTATAVTAGAGGNELSFQVTQGQASLSEGGLTATAKDYGQNGAKVSFEIVAAGDGTYTVNLYWTGETNEPIDTITGVTTVEDLSKADSDYVTFSGSGDLTAAGLMALSLKNSGFNILIYEEKTDATGDTASLTSKALVAELDDVTTAAEATAWDNGYLTFSGSGDLTETPLTTLSGGDGLVSLFTPILYLSMAYYGNTPQFLQILLLALSVLAYGPTKCGVTYVLRNFSRESHSWLTDIWDKAKENWKQGMLFGVIDFLVLALIVFNMTYTPAAGMETVIQISKYLTLFFAMLYCFMRKYLYLMIVTVRLNLRSLVKNAWLLAFIGIFRNFFSGLANLAIWVGAYLLILAVHPLLEIPLIVLLIYSFTNFLSIYATYPLVEKYLVVPIQELQAAEEAKALKPEPDAVAEDEGSKRDTKLF